MEEIEVLQKEIVQLKQVLIGMTYLQPMNEHQIIYDIPINFSVEGILNGIGKMVENYCFTQMKQIPGVQKRMEYFESSIEELKSQSSLNEIQIKQFQSKQIQQTDKIIKLEQAQMSLGQQQQINNQEFEKLEQLNGVNKKQEEQHKQLQQIYVDMSKIEKKLMAYCLRLDEKLNTQRDGNTKLMANKLDEQQQQILLLKEQIQININNINSKNEKIQQTLQQLLMDQQNKVDSMDFQIFEDKLRNCLKYSDLEYINKQFQEQIYEIKGKITTQEQSGIALKQLFKEFDYALLTKSSKMDYEILQTDSEAKDKQIKLLNKKILEFMDDFQLQRESINERIELKCKEYISESQSHLRNSSTEKIEETIKSYLQKYDLNQIVLTHRRMVSQFDQKADQSQIAEMMQNKANLTEVTTLNQRQNNTKMVIRQILDALIIYIEAMHSTEDSFNIKKSDISKAINALKGLSSKIKPNELVMTSITSQEDSKSVGRNYNVKLRPTLYRTQQHQRRIKTEND